MPSIATYSQPIFDAAAIKLNTACVRIKSQRGTDVQQSRERYPTDFPHLQFYTPALAGLFMGFT